MIELTAMQVVEMAMAVPGRAKTPLRELLDAGLPGRLALEVARLARAIDGEWRAIEEARSGLVTANGEPDEIGRMAVKPKKMAEFMTAWGQVLAQDVRIDREPVAIPDAVLDRMIISPGAMVALMPAFVFGEKK